MGSRARSIAKMAITACMALGAGASNGTGAPQSPTQGPGLAPLSEKEDNEDNEGENTAYSHHRSIVVLHHWLVKGCHQPWFAGIWTWGGLLHLGPPTKGTP